MINQDERGFQKFWNDSDSSVHEKNLIGKFLHNRSQNKKHTKLTERTCQPMNLKLFGQVSKKSEYSVFGYIRDIQHKLPRDIAYFNIPMSIYQMCTLYYHRFEKWDPDNKDSTYEIIDDYILHQTMEGWGSAFLTNIVKIGKHDWIFKLTEYPAHRNVCIGIVKMDKDKPTKSHLGLEPDTVYSFLANFALTNVHCSRDEWRNKYGEKCKKGDEIGMHLDLNKLTLSFSINGKDFGKAYDIDKCEYKAAINMTQKGCKLELVSYQQTW